MAEDQSPAGTEAGQGGVVGGPRRGALNLLTIIAMGVAVLALALCAVLFMQLSKAQGALKHAALPEGLKEGGEGADGEKKDTPAVMGDPKEVTYELGDFTANSKDGKFVKLNLALKLKSFYLQADWDNYQMQLEQYNQQRQQYFDYQKKQSSGASKASWTRQPDASAGVMTLASYRPGGSMIVVPAAEGKKEAPPTLPDKEPIRPLTRLEQEMKDDEAHVRSIINEEINSLDAASLISPAGKAEFKKNVMDALNGAFDTTKGTVEDIYFRDMVTT